MKTRFRGSETGLLCFPRVGRDGSGQGLKPPALPPVPGWFRAGAEAPARRGGLMGGLVPDCSEQGLKPPPGGGGEEKHRLRRRGKANGGFSPCSQPFGTGPHLRKPTERGL